MNWNENKKIKTAYSLLAVAIIKSGFLSQDDVFIGGEWINNLYEMTGTKPQDYKQLYKIGVINSKIQKINYLIYKAKYTNRDATKYKEEKAKLNLEKKLLIKENNKKKRVDKK